MTNNRRERVGEPDAWWTTYVDLGRPWSEDMFVRVVSDRSEGSRFHEHAVTCAQWEVARDNYHGINSPRKKKLTAMIAIYEYQHASSRLDPARAMQMAFFGARREAQRLADASPERHAEKIYDRFLQERDSTPSPVDGTVGFIREAEVGAERRITAAGHLREIGAWALVVLAFCWMAVLASIIAAIGGATSPATPLVLVAILVALVAIVHFGSR